MRLGVFARGISGEDLDLFPSSSRIIVAGFLSACVDSEEAEKRSSATHSFGNPFSKKIETECCVLSCKMRIPLFCFAANAAMTMRSVALAMCMRSVISGELRSVIRPQ